VSRPADTPNVPVGGLDDHPQRGCRGSAPPWSPDDDRLANVGQATISIIIDPPEITLHVGQTQSFMALVGGAVNLGIQWAVEEADGGSITREGVYTAPNRLISTRDPTWPAVQSA